MTKHDCLMQNETCTHKPQTLLIYLLKTVYVQVKGS